MKSKKIIIRRDIVWSISPLFYFSKVSGLAPFNCSTGKSSIWDMLYSLILTSFVLCSFLYTITMKINYQYPQSSYTVMIPDIFKTFVSYPSLLITLVLFSTWHRRKFQAFFRKISFVDKVLLQPDHFNNTVQRKTKIIISSQLSVVVITILILFWYDYFVWSDDHNACEYFQAIPLHMMGASIFLQFVNLIILLRHRYAFLNKKLENYFEKQVFSPSSNSHNSFQISRSAVRDNLRIAELQALHISLHEAAHIVSSCYGITLLLELAYLFVKLIQDMYCTLVTAFNMDYVETRAGVGETVGILLCWVLVSLFKMVFIAISCQMTSNEANHTRALVHKLMAKGVSATSLRRFSHQLLHYELHFTTCGIVVLNSTMLHSLAGAVTTYLIILLQFQFVVSSSSSSNTSLSPFFNESVKT